MGGEGRRGGGGGGEGIGADQAYLGNMGGVVVEEEGGGGSEAKRAFLVSDIGLGM